MNIVVDLETLSTRANASIVVIAAIKFSGKEEFSENISEEELFSMKNTFYRRIKINTEEKKYHIDNNTVTWWNTQPKEIIYESLEHPDRTELKQALTDFTKWVGNNKDRIKIWGNGSSFDITILGEAFALEGLEICWCYWNIRDIRTLFDIGNVKMNELPNFSKHHALWDCYREIIGYQRAIKNIDNKKRKRS
jgi:DNA polymerase III epsilon subunit-like protein